jgi:predicted HicB family RNase H-like nuclease
MRKARFKKQLTIAISPEHFEQIKKITDAKQISMGEWVREAVNTALETHRQKGDLCNEQ